MGETAFTTVLRQDVGEPRHKITATVLSERQTLMENSLMGRISSTRMFIRRSLSVKPTSICSPVSEKQRPKEVHCGPLMQVAK
eukprot:scaffold2162_cov398-Prasinococcus_capsulatus_cf.AAC.10